MADHEPQENEKVGSGEGEGRNLLGLPAKIRVHALAKLLGLTSKQVIAKAAERGTEVRSAHSTLPRDIAEDLHAALSEPADTETTTPTAETPAEAPTPTESDALPISPESDTAASDTPESDTTVAEAEPSEQDRLAVVAETPEPADPGEPEAVRIPSVGGPTGLFTSAESTPLFEIPEPGPVTEPVVAAPLFLQPEVPSAGDDSDEDTRPRRRRSRRGGTSASTETPQDSGTVEQQPAATEESTATEAEPERSEDDQDDHPRRRRRGRRGRGRGRGDSDQQHDESSSQDEGVAETAEDEKSGADAPDGSGETPGDDSSGDTSDRDDTSETAGSDDAGDSSSDDDTSGDDEQAEGTSRRRRRRRRRRGSSDTDTASTEDDSVPTVIHERDPRPKTRVKDEVQGISGSTRLEAKRQRRRDGREAGRRRPPILTESEFLARRESVDRVMVVRERTSGAHAGMTQVAVLEDGVLVEHFVTSSGSASMVGNIYLGRVQNVLPSMEAAFIDIGRGRNGVLYAGEVNWEAAGLGGNSRKIEQALKPGDQVVVQVSKDPVGHKGARLTTQISLAGRFLVYVPGGTSTGISRKLPDTERKRLKDILREIVPADAGVIIRTAAEGVSEEELARDVTRLQAQWDSIREHSDKLQADASGQPKTLYEEPDLLVKVVRDLFNEDFSKLVIEGESAWKTVENYIRTVAPDLLPRVEKYQTQNSVDVFGAHRIDEQLAKALDRKVWLPSGGTLVIDRTEAMTVVDVNTGKFTGAGGNLEETVTRNNLEAAEEIVRQMRLRDIGGMIVVDFIDMVLESNRDLVLRRLTEALGRDRTRHQVSEVTSLGLVQMTRKRLGTGLVEAFSTTCEHCNGRGLIVHSEPVETKPADDSGRSQSGGSRRKRGRDKSAPQQEVPAETPAASASPDEEAAKRAAHPVALAMAAQQSEPETDPVKVSEPLRAAEPESVVSGAGGSAAGEDTTTVAPAVTEQSEAAEQEQVASEVAAAEAAVAPVDAAGEVQEPAESGPSQSGAAAPVAESGAPRRRRARRVARAAAAPTGDGDGAGSVFVVPAPASEPEPVAQAAETASSEPTPTPVAIVRRPRSRRAAGRPAGPPVDAEA